LHICPPVHDPHESVPPHSFEGVPHWAPTALHEVAGVQTHVPPEHVSAAVVQLLPAQHASPVAPQATQAPALLHTWDVPHDPHETPHPLSPHILPVQLPMQLHCPLGLHVPFEGHVPVPQVFPHPSVPHTLPVHVHAAQVPDVRSQTLPVLHLLPVQQSCVAAPQGGGGGASDATSDRAESGVVA
jgi:hypothetical protein